MAGIVVLISGRGSNLQAICNSGLSHHIRCVISNKSDAGGIIFAQNNGLKTHIIEHRSTDSREDFDRKVADIIDAHKPDLIVLAGFMRILSNWFVKHYAKQLINIHPSLLPAFSGTIHAQQDAFHAQVKVTGATVHFVGEKIDGGPIIAQGIVPVLVNDDEITLNQRILELEHVIYPFIIHKFLNKQVTFNSSNNISVLHNNDDSKWLGKFVHQIFY